MKYQIKKNSTTSISCGEHTISNVEHNATINMSGGKLTITSDIEHNCNFKMLGGIATINGAVEHNSVIHVSGGTLTINGDIEHDSEINLNSGELIIIGNIDNSVTINRNGGTIKCKDIEQNPHPSPNVFFKAPPGNTRIIIGNKEIDVTVLGNSKVFYAETITGGLTMSRGK